MAKGLSTGQYYNIITVKLNTAVTNSIKNLVFFDFVHSNVINWVIKIESKFYH